MTHPNFEQFIRRGGGGELDKNYRSVTNERILLPHFEPPKEWLIESGSIEGSSQLIRFVFIQCTSACYFRTQTQVLV